MAYIGMRYPVAAQVSSHTDGSAITYGTGFVVSSAVAATVNITSNESKDYGDDIVQDTDNGITGYNISLETNDLPVASLVGLMGWIPDNQATPTKYDMTGDAAPLVGFGYIRVKRNAGVLSYESFWFHKCRFTPSSIEARTKEENITWQHPTITAEGQGCYIDSSGKPKFAEYMLHTTEAAAKTWLNSRANIT